MILGKSNHPVEIKQIPLRSWPLRAEIEVALKTCLKEDGTLDEAKASEIRELFDKISYPDQATVTNIETKKEEEDSEEAENDSEAKADSNDSTDEDSQGATEDNQEADSEWCQRYRPEDDQIFSGKSLLSDIHMDSIVFFSEKEYTPGQTITLEIINAKPFCLHVKVNNIMNFSRNSKVITPTKMAYRVLGSFLFPFEEEKKHLRAFLERIEPEVLALERAKKQQEKEKSPENALDKAEEEEQAEGAEEVAPEAEQQPDPES